MVVGSECDTHYHNYWKIQAVSRGGASCKTNPLSRDFLQLTNKKAVAGENSFTDTMRHVLSSRLSMPDCPNCNYRRR